MLRSATLMIAALFAVATTPAQAQDREVPYWATIRESASELFMRVGPSQDYQIAWVYKRPGLPLKVVRVIDGWRRVQDPAGDEGWVSANLLSSKRGAIVIGDGLAALRAEPVATSPLRWNLEPGVVGNLGKCENAFCEFDVEGRKGWVSAERLWGAGDP